MLKKIVILILVFASTIQANFTCQNDSMCIPLSECNEIGDLIANNNTLNYARSFVCGYFHEPYVCCDRTCNTPNGNYGRSLRLNECFHLKAIENSNKLRQMKFLDESHINETHVCCNEGEDRYISVPAAPLALPSVPKLTVWSCITLNGETARCKNINECEAYKEAAVETDQNFRFVNDSFCGLWEEPMVCCGDASVYMESYSKNLPDSKKCGVWDNIVPTSIPPWLALIKSNLSANYCIGALINVEYVLTTVQCVGTGSHEIAIDVTFGDCLLNEARDDCTFQVTELKVFPLYAYRLSEDVGMVLLKLNRGTSATNGFMPVCLPVNDLAIAEEIDLIGLEKVNSHWIGRRTSTKTIHNDSCHNAMKAYFERIVCVKNGELCKNTKMSLLQNFLLRNENGRWFLEGLFNKKNCYGLNADFLNTIYVFKFVPWIKSNIQ